MYSNPNLKIVVGTCVSKNFPEGLKLLLAKLPNYRASNCFEGAIENNYVQCVKCFLDSGYDPNGNEYDAPILHVRSIENAEILIVNGADINYCIPPDLYANRYSIEHFGDLNDQEVSIFGILCEILFEHENIYTILPSGEKQLCDK